MGSRLGVGSSSRVAVVNIRLRLKFSNVYALQNTCSRVDREILFELRGGPLFF